MRFLLISCILLFASCSSYPKKNNWNQIITDAEQLKNPYFSNLSTDYIYKARVKVYDKEFSGILIVKKIKEKEHRVVFTTEMGNKFFDFLFKGDEFKVISIINSLDKKILVNILKKDFKMLITESIDISKSYKDANKMIYKAKFYGKNHYYSYSDDQLNEIVRTGFCKEKSKVIYLINENFEQADVLIKHSDIKLEISLKAI